MPIYLFHTPGARNGLERIMLNFPKGVDLQTAMEYVSQHYRCKAAPIRLTPESADVVEVMRQTKKTADEQDEESVFSDGENVEFDDGDESEVVGGDNDPQSPSR